MASPNHHLDSRRTKYETSGVQGAILFLQTAAETLGGTFNILVAPCVSPWGYETIQRWNAQAVDPNRSFNPEGEVVAGRSFNPEAATEESGALITLLKTLDVDHWTCHIDLHETTDTGEIGWDRVFHRAGLHAPRARALMITKDPLPSNTTSILISIRSGR